MVRLTDRTKAGLPLTSLLAAESANSSRTEPKSSTVNTTPLGSVTSGSLAISLPTSRLFFPRSNTSWPTVCILPAGISRFSRAMIRDTCWSDRPYLRSVSSLISTSIWKSGAPNSVTCDTVLSCSSSSRTCSATARSCSRSTSPSWSGAITATRMAASRIVISWTFGSSASSGKLGMRSTSERTSVTIFCTSLTSAWSSSTTDPAPSAATEVIFLMPSIDRTPSSIF